MVIIIYTNSHHRRTFDLLSTVASARNKLISPLRCVPRPLCFACDLFGIILWCLAYASICWCVCVCVYLAPSSSLFSAAHSLISEQRFNIQRSGASIDGANSCHHRRGNDGHIIHIEWMVYFGAEDKNLNKSSPIRVWIARQPTNACFGWDADHYIYIYI